MIFQGLKDEPRVSGYAEKSPRFLISCVIERRGLLSFGLIESPIQECHDLAASADLIGTEVAGGGHIAYHNFPVFVKGNIDKVKT